MTLGETAPSTATDAIAIDADTRNLPAKEAADRSTSIVRQILQDEEQILFKKLDSTLRGNAGSELAAMLRVRGSATSSRVLIVLAPAFPAHGRTTVDGHQLLHGRHLHETELGQREQMSGKCDLAAIMRTVGLNTGAVPLRLVRSGGHELKSALSELCIGKDVLICDAETQSDLRIIASSAITLDRSILWAGSAGLAYELPPAAGLSKPVETAELPPLSANPTLFVIGSTSTVTRDQLGYLASCFPISVIVIATQTLLDGPSSPVWQQARTRIDAELEANKDTVVVIDGGVVLARGVAAGLAIAVGRLLIPFRCSAGALVASGGETARAVLQAWGISALRLIRELEPGLPLAIADDSQPPLLVVTKAGAFGRPSTLLNCLRALEEVKSLQSKGNL